MTETPKPLTEKELEEMEELLNKAGYGELKIQKLFRQMGEEPKWRVMAYREIGDDCWFPIATFDEKEDAQIFIIFQNNAKSLIAELKRLRAGPMQAREDDFRDELIDRINHAMQNIEDHSYLYKDLRGMIDLIESSPKQTSETKGMPSEKQKKELETIIENHLHNDHSRIRLFDEKGCVRCWTLSRLKQSWGIE